MHAKKFLLQGAAALLCSSNTQAAILRLHPSVRPSAKDPAPQFLGPAATYFTRIARGL